MATKTKQTPEQKLVATMAAHLRLTLAELRAQYAQVQAEAQRLKRAGGAVRELYDQVQQLERGESGRPNGEK